MTARTIATLEERWALPRGTVIRDAAGVAWVKRPAQWMATTPIEDDQWIGMPATVVHDPLRDAKAEHAEIARAAQAKAASLYPFDGSDPDVIIALRQAFRDGALSSLEGSPT